MVLNSLNHGDMHYNSYFSGSFGKERWVQVESSNFGAKFHSIHVQFSLLGFSFFQILFITHFSEYLLLLFGGILFLSPVRGFI